MFLNYLQHHAVDVIGFTDFYKTYDIRMLKIYLENKLKSLRFLLLLILQIIEFDEDITYH